MSGWARVAVPVFDMTVEAAPAAVRYVRSELREFLQRHDVTAEVRRRVLDAITEAVANAVQHAYAGRTGTVTVLADIDRDLQVVVSDHGDGLRQSPTPGTGNGMLVLADRTDGLGLREERSGGLEVWMRFHLTTSN